MTVDPYDNMPSREDLKESGAEDWVLKAFADQKKKDASLRSNLDAERASLKAKRKDLAGLLDSDASGTNDEPPAPDLFAAERAQAAKEKAALSGFVSDMEKSRAAEKEMLKNLFGG